MDYKIDIRIIYDPVAKKWVAFFGERCHEEFSTFVRAADYARGMVDTTVRAEEKAIAALAGSVTGVTQG